MKKHQFVIKKIEGGYGIFLRRFPEHPLAKFDTKKAAKHRHKEYLKNVKEN